MSLKVVELKDRYLEDAAGLFVNNYRSFKRVIPLLPDRYADPVRIGSMLLDLIQNNPGVAAFEGERLVGYLVGFVLKEFQGLRTAYSPEWAAVASFEASPRIFQDMYSRLAQNWFADGCLQHLVSLFARDPDGIQGWVRMGFGMVAFDALRQPGALDGGLGSIEVRRVNRDEAGELQVFFDGLQRHLACPPAFWLHRFPEPAEWLSKPGREMFLAYIGGEPAGCMGLDPGHPDGCDILKDPGTATIEIVYIQPEFRRQGVGRALLDHFLMHAQSQDFLRCAVEYESANLTAARFWERWFDPVCCSLLRRIDERICAP
jgi:GNAT superfamily N-acetyltransferase